MHNEMNGNVNGSSVQARDIGSVMMIGSLGSPVQDTLAKTADQLAQAVRTRWQQEEEQRQIQYPFPLPVRWQPAPEDLTDHWANICRAPAGATAEPLALTGQLDQIVEVYRQIPSARLVVLGRTGSGKTILTMRFALGLLDTRTNTDPVPVIFSLGSWNPTTTSLRDWLTSQLERDYPSLAATGHDKSTLAAALVKAGRILPVLDGFDEIAEGLHRAALEALNATTTLPVLLTSRRAEYAAAVVDTDVLSCAAVVELTDLTLTDLVNYLPRTTRKTTVWDPVLTKLREDPQSLASVNLATVLTTPLMVVLARTIYSDTPDHNPSVLLETDRFSTPEALEDHLLGNFIPTVYRHQPGHRAARGHPRRRRCCDPHRVQHWLGYLAWHLDQLGTRDLAWWQLGDTIPRSARRLAAGVEFGLTLGFASGLTIGLVAGPRSEGRDPSHVQLQIRSRTRQIPQAIVVGLAYVLVFGLVGRLVRGLAGGLVLGLVCGLLSGLVYVITAMLMLQPRRVDIRAAVSPSDLLITDRKRTNFLLLANGLGLGLVFGLAGRLVGGFASGPILGLILGPSSGLALGLLSVSVFVFAGRLGSEIATTAWARWLVLSRIWLPLTGRLPWPVMAFLEDAHQRGVLRQAGAVYQFRHARLQDHLTRTYQARCSRQPARSR